MREEKTVVYDGVEILVITNLTDKDTGVYTASAVYKEYPNAVVCLESGRDKEALRTTVVQKLIDGCPPDAVEFL